MSPISIALPPPNVEWVSQFFAPLVGASGVFAGNHGAGVAGPLSPVAAMNYVAARPVQARDFWLQAANGAPSQLLQGIGTVGAGTNARWAQQRGRQCMWDQSTNNSVSGDMMVPADWLPDLRGSAAAVPAGALQDDASLVGVFDFHLSSDLAAAPPWANDTVGVFFLPFFPNASPTVPSGSGIDIRQVPGAATGTPGDPDDVGGFGVFFNTVAAAPRLEYVSWGTGSPGAILERITVPLAVAPNVTNWNSVRFVIIGARPSFGATLTVQVNSQDVLPVRSFGSAQLNEPDTSAVGAAGLAVGFNIAGAGGVFPSIFSQWHMKFGRFTPGGEEVQAP